MAEKTYAQFGFPVSMPVQRALRLTIDLCDDLALEEDHPQSKAVLSLLRSVAMDALEEGIELNRRWAAKHSVRKSA